MKFRVRVLFPRLSVGDNFLRVCICHHIAQLPILASVLCLVKATCERTEEAPSVAVKNSTHIYVSWGKAFKGCEKEKVQNATVVVGTLH